MRRLSLFLPIIFSVLILPIALANASTPAVGTMCMKAGGNKTVSGIKFTCTKSGKKLIWVKDSNSALQKISLTSFINLAQAAISNPENAIPTVGAPDSVKITSTTKNNLAKFLIAKAPRTFTFFGPTPLTETKSDRAGALSLITADNRKVYKSQDATPPWAVGFNLTTKDPQGRFSVITSGAGNPAQTYSWRLAYKAGTGLWKYQNISGTKHPSNNQKNFDEVTLGAPGKYSIRLEFLAMTTFYGVGLNENLSAVTPLATSNALRVAILGDSWVTPSFEESGPVHDWDAYPGALTWLTGWNVISAGVRGQGYLQTASNETYKDRVIRDLVPQNPSVIIFTGSSNDHLFPDQQIAEEMGRDILALQKAAPDILIIVCSPYQNGPDQKAPGQSKAMQAEAKKLGIPYIDFIELPLFDQNNNGQNQLTKGHPTRLGGSYTAIELLKEIAAIK